MDLQEKQYELGGVVFGLDCPVEVKSNGWVPGTAAVRSQDVDHPTGDGVRLGKDYKGGATWSFSLFTNAQDEKSAWAALRELATVWDNEEIRTTSGAVMPLRYRVAGETRVVYGRPRRWTASPNNDSMQGKIEIECDFLVADPIVYSDVLQTKLIPIAPPLELDAGLLVPFIPPFNTAAGASVQESSVTIGGEISTPITLTFNGPVSDAAVRVGGWTAALPDPVDPDNPVTIDGRPWVRAATTRGGAGVRVSPRVTRISKMWLPPGHHEVIFTGEDITSTASVLVSWREAYRTPR